MKMSEAKFLFIGLACAVSFGSVASVNLAPKLLAGPVEKPANQPQWDPFSWLHKYASFEPREEKKIVVLICSYNNALWYESNLDSVRTQDYTNFRVVYVDDGSSDGTADKVAAYIKKHGLQDQFTLIRSDQRRRKLYHLYDKIHTFDDDAIVVEVDGDDFLYHNQVLSLLNKVYLIKNAWLTYGRFMCLTTRHAATINCLPVSVVDAGKQRDYRWVTTHLKTYYAWLFKKVKQADLVHNGEFFPMATDVAIMMPMLEMARFHAIYIPDILYVYNNQNSNRNVHTHPGLQEELSKIIRSKERYTPLCDMPVKRDNQDDNK